MIALQDIGLADGRRLSFSVLGPRDGYPVLYMHGAIGSPMRRSPQLDAAITDLGIRYVMVNRPGFGGSDAQPGRRVLDFAGDVEHLADLLGLRRFSIVGVSAGAPYALACAKHMPERIDAASVVSPLSQHRPLHFNRAIRARYRLPLRLLAETPQGAIAVADRIASVLRRRPSIGLRLMMLGAADADRNLLRVPEARAALSESFQFAIRAGATPMVDDYLVCARRWGFEAEQIQIPVHLWHGAHDRLVPLDEAKLLAAELPRSELHVINAGHFFYQRRLFQILSGTRNRPNTLSVAA